MIQKKICLIGSPAVGKTSLVRRFVHGQFSEEYLTTIGVKIDRKDVTVGDEDVHLMVWDVNGDDTFTPLRPAYLRGASGLLVVADGTRAFTLDHAVTLRDELSENLQGLPAVLLLNKRDLEEAWEIQGDQLEPLHDAGWKVIETSALSGFGVEDAFLEIARAMLENGH